MGLQLFLSVVSLAQVLHVSQGQDFPICQMNTKPYHGPQLPTLPTAFTAHVEANIVNKDYSMLLTEYYDQASNKGAIKMKRNGGSSLSIYDYNLNEMMAINMKNKTCTVQNITTMHGHSFFGRNSSKIEGIADLFRFGAQFNETFLGNATVRGIPCYHWQACIHHHHSSYLVDYYFSSPDWSMPDVTSMRVVRATINGTSNQTHGVPSNKTRSFYHVYDFYDFKAGKPSLEIFQVPRGMYCAGKKDRKPLPKMHPVFSFQIESVSFFNKSIMHFQEHYDLDRKLVMFQYYDYRHNKKPEQTHLIHDFYHGVKYNISGYVCQQVARLSKNNTRWDGKETKDHHIEMMTPREMMFRRNISELVYKGQDTVRGIPTDVWIMQKMSTYRNMLITSEYYYSHPSFNMRAGSLNKQFQVLLKINTYGPNKNLWSTMNVINYDGEKVPLSTFSIGACFIGKRSFISLKFAGDWKDLVYMQETPFLISVRNAVVKATNISALRVDGLKTGDGKDNNIFVWFTLLDKPTITSPDAPPENDLKKALEMLEKSVKAGDLIVTWKTPMGGKLMTTYAEKSFFENSMATQPTRPPKGKLNPVKKGVHPGAVVGIAFLMVAIGVLIGLGVAHVIMKRRGLSLFQYQRQE